MAAVVSGGTVTNLESRLAGVAPVAYGPLLVEGTVETWQDYLAKVSSGVDPMQVWATQPSVRKVVDFAARALASTPLKVYRRVSDTDRPRVTDHPLARIMATPRPGSTAFRFWHNVLTDWLLFDRWCVLKKTSTDTARGLDLIRVQAQRASFAGDGLGEVDAIWVDGRIKLDIGACLFDRGYSPLGASGTSPMMTLGAILQESQEAVNYRRGVWKQGARVPGVIERPATAPVWSDPAKTRFLEGWRRYARGGGQEGGTPILEDGMKLVKAEAFSPRDAQDIEGRKLNDAEVASAYHIAPELVGAREGNYSNIDVFRQMKYRDSLGPYYVAWEQVINALLVPDLDPTGELYVEADLDAKLRGSFEEQAKILSTAVGAPYMYRNEARGRLNLPAVDGGDELVTPLNVLIGGQASPRDTGTQNLNSGKARGFKARAGDTYDRKAGQVLTDYFTRQRDAVLAALGAKAAGDWWDGAKWDTELSGALYGLAATVAAEVGPASAEALGYDRGAYDPDRTVAFLRAVSDTRAANMNATTKAQLDEALKADEPDLEAVYALALAQRVPAASASIVTASSGFGSTEAARQLGGGKAVKTWDTGSNPRESHAAMNGETVGIDDKFSNGLSYPGDGGDPEETAGCNCGVTISIP